MLDLKLYKLFSLLKDKPVPVSTVFVLVTMKREAQVKDSSVPAKVNNCTYSDVY